jgi:quercetin dioxygenase-like cupin family protein
VSEIIPKVWGREVILLNTSLYAAKYLEIDPGGRSSLHFHKVKTETFYVTDGICYLTHLGKLSVLLPGDKRTIYPNEQHRFQVPLKGTFCRVLEVSTHDDAADSYRLEPSSKQK